MVIKWEGSSLVPKGRLFPILEPKSRFPRGVFIFWFGLKILVSWVPSLQFVPVVNDFPSLPRINNLFD